MTGDRRKLSDEDIQAFVRAINECDSHCRYKGIDPQELSEAVVFFRSLNIAITDSKKTIRNTLIKMAVAGLVGLVLFGAGAKIKQALIP